jgi:hypothetical protein
MPLGLFEIIILLVLIGGVYFIIRMKWYTQALIGIAVVGAVGATIAGLVMLFDDTNTNDMVATILTLGGIVLTLGCAIVAKFALSGQSPPT